MAAAQALREKTCGVLFGIETCRPYCPRAVEADARREQKDGPLPCLMYPVPPMSQYDIILVGGPVWHDTLPPPLMSFLREADFAGRHVAPFCIHEDGAGVYFMEFKKQARNALLLDGMDLRISRRYCEVESGNAFDAWLAKLGICGARAAGAGTGGLAAIKR